MPAIQSHCFNHPEREASARCPVCHNFFCRECVIEHEDKLLCAACAAKLDFQTQPPPSRRLFWPILNALLAFLLLWGIFFTVGFLARLSPDTTHKALFSGSNAGAFYP